MDLKTMFLILSTIVGFITPLIAILSVFRGEYKPHRTTRTIFLFILSISVLSLFAQGDRGGFFLALTQWTGNFILFILSFKFGVGGREKTDIIVLLIAILTVIIWKTTNDPVLALYMAILSDFIGFSPTLIKAYKQPHTEDAKIYSSDLIAGFFNLLSLRTYGVVELAFPGYIFLINLVQVLIIIVRRKFYKLNVGSRSISSKSFK